MTASVLLRRTLKQQNIQGPGGSYGLAMAPSRSKLNSSVSKYTPRNWWHWCNSTLAKARLYAFIHLSIPPIFTHSVFLLFGVCAVKKLLSGSGEVLAVGCKVDTGWLRVWDFWARISGKAAWCTICLMLLCPPNLPLWSSGVQCILPSPFSHVCPSTVLFWWHSSTW